MSDPSKQMLDPALFVRYFLSLRAYAESLISPDIFPHNKSWVSGLITGLRPIWFQNMIKKTNLSDIDELIRHCIKMAAQFRRFEVIKASATSSESTHSKQSSNKRKIESSSSDNKQKQSSSADAERNCQSVMLVSIVVLLIIR